MKYKTLLISGLFLIVFSSHAKTTKNISSGADSAHLELQKVSDTVYAIVGPLTQRSAKNLGNNATFGFVITKQGVVLIDSGGGFKAAKKIHNLIKTVTKKKIKIVINTGGQDHRWFGNDYFKMRGASIIASKVAVADQKKRANFQYTRLANLIGDKNIAGTKNVFADILFDKKYKFSLGGIEFEIMHSGHAHTPGDSYVWMPKEKIVFSGDIIYMERMLSVGSMSNAKSWISAYSELIKLKPKIIIPGHGHAAGIAKANKDTFEYLNFIYNGMKKLHQSGLTEEKVSTLDQSKYKYLKAYDQLKGRNALKVFMELEFDSMQ